MIKTILVGLLLVILAVITIALVIGLVNNVVPNKSPVITIEPVTNATVDQTILINATIKDDGQILASIWEQESGPETNITQVAEDMYFTPTVNGTYLFSLEVQDDKQAIVEQGIIVDVKPLPPVIPEPPICKPTEKLENGKCVPIPPVKPTCTADQVYNPATNKCDPKPVVLKDIKVTVTADVEDSTAGNAVFSQIQKQNADYDFVLGDLGYESNLAWFKSTYGTLGDKMWCVMGNHESDDEDGSAGIEKETLEFCGNSYWIRYGANIFIVLNTNDDQPTLINAFKKTVTNGTIMSGVKTIHIFSHKGCAVPPNSHHGLEIQDLCNVIKSSIPSTLKVYYTSAHNHVLSESADGVYKQSGAGGRSHYTCGTNSAFPFCNNTHYGFLVYNIKPDGTTTHQWIDSNGGVIR